MKLLPVAAILALLILSQPAQAYYFREQLPKVTAIAVIVEDNVTDGCLPSPNVLKVEAELILRRSGIIIHDDVNAGAHVLVIVTLGGASGSGSYCIGAMAIQLARRETLLDTTSGVVDVAGRFGVWTTQKSEFQDKLKSAVNEVVTGIANEILKARGQ